MDDNEYLPFDDHADYYLIEIQTPEGYAPFMDSKTHLPVAFRTQEGAEEEALGISGFRPLVNIRVLHVVHSEDVMAEFIGGKRQ